MQQAALSAVKCLIWQKYSTTIDFSYDSEVRLGVLHYELLPEFSLIYDQLDTSQGVPLPQQMKVWTDGKKINKIP